MKLLRIFFYAAAGMLVLNSCKMQDPSWNSDFLVPLAKSKLSIKDLVPDSLVKVSQDSNVHIVYSKELYGLAVDSIFSFSDTGVIRSFNIDSLSLFTTETDFKITLGDIARNAGLAGLLILGQHGKQIPVPAISPISSPVLPFDGDSLFTTMTLNEGNIDVSMYNGLPIEITNVLFDLKNSSDNSLVLQGSFPSIPPGTTMTRTFLLNGKTVEGKLNAQLISLSSPGSNGIPVLIDTNNFIQAGLKVYNLHPITATAVFPAQNLINNGQNFVLKNLPVFLKESKAKSGQILIKLFSTLEDSIYMTYRLPSATLNGVPFEVKKTLPPAPPGGLSSFEKLFDFSGYLLDLSGKNGDTINTAYNEFVVRIEYTGIKKTLSKKDSIYAQLSFLNLKPEYARGYLGNQTYDYGPAEIEIDGLSDINGHLDLANVKLDVEAENFIGADASFEIKEFSSVNSRNNKTVDLTGSYKSGSITVPRANEVTAPELVRPSYTQLNIDQSNSNIKAFVANLPDKIKYSLFLQTNPQGNTSNYRDFVYDGKFLNLRLLVDVPLEFSASGISLMDTIDLDLNYEDVSKVESATLYFLADNSFPMDCELQFYLYDPVLSSMTALLPQNAVIKAGLYDPVLQKVTSATFTKIPVEFTKLKIEQLFNSKKILAKAIFSTAPPNTKVKIFSDAGIDLKITGLFNYLID